VAKQADGACRAAIKTDAHSPGKATVNRSASGGRRWRCGKHLPAAGQGGNMKESDLPLVRGGKLPKEALHWLAEVEKHFSGTTRDIIVIRQKPISPSPREAK
jgi:hypothetical protein